MFFEPLFGVQTLKDSHAKSGFESIDDMQKLDKNLIVKVYEAIDKSVIEGDYVVFRLATPCLRLCDPR